jgi:hypothetical protein
MSQDYADQAEQQRVLKWVHLHRARRKGPAKRIRSKRLGRTRPAWK